MDETGAVASTGSYTFNPNETMAVPPNETMAVPPNETMAVASTGSYTFNPDDTNYGNVYMEKARGRILFAISEMNTTRKGYNAVANMFRTNESTGDIAPTLRGIAYLEALKQIVTRFENEPANLGDYSTTSNFFGRSQKAFGGRRKRKSSNKTKKTNKKK